jgi:ABC-type transport system substrate-binding protein
MSGGASDTTVRRTVYEQLVTRTESGEIKPLLATSWEISQDGKVLTFTLRRNVRFHDGTPLTASAVKASLDRLLDPAQGLPLRLGQTWIKAVEAQGDLTVRIITDAPFGPALQHLAHTATSVISPGALARHGKDIAWHPVGTGPYRYESHVPGETVTLTRFDGYWSGRPDLDRIVFRTVREDGTRVALLEAGEAHVVDNVPGTDVARLQKDPRLKVRLDASTRVAHIGMNVQRPPFNNMKVRQALNYAVYRRAIVRGVLHDVGVPVATILSPATWGYFDPGIYTYDTARAKQLLAEAGYPNGFQTVLWTPEGRYYMDRQTAVAVQGQLQLVGVQAEVRVIDWATYLQILRRPVESSETQMYLLGWETSTGDAAYVLDIVFRSEAWPPRSWNTMFYKNPEADRFIAAGTREIDPNKRARIYQDLQRVIMTDAPWIPLYAYQHVAGMQKTVERIQILPGEEYTLRDVYLSR